MGYTSEYAQKAMSENGGGKKKKAKGSLEMRVHSVDKKTGKKTLIKDTGAEKARQHAYRGAGGRKT
jgi:hypothetical protein